MHFFKYIIVDSYPSVINTHGCPNGVLVAIPWVYVYIYIYIYLCIPLFLCLHMHIPRYIQHHMYIYHIYSLGHPVGRDFPAYCIWKLAKFGWYSGFWFRGFWVGVLNLSQMTPPVSRKSYRDNRWIIFHLLNSAYCIRVPDGLNCPRSQ